MIAFEINCASNFGPDPLYDGIHFSIRNTFDLRMYMHKSTLVYIYIHGSKVRFRKLVSTRC